ncbi:acyl-CoA carboxylase subunit epsilon [Streptomyces sp. x-80]|jgi:hypothetical protein|uniref:acyl-CoA carboxylase subunit epsilon n=1 Tax=Streptomyces sp. x-80 TaxID=2789282 RepID=UPI0039816B19
MNTPGDVPGDVQLRVEKGHAEPEELAAIAVILCAHFAPAPEAAPHHTANRRRIRHVARCACWSGCWSCR